MHISVIYIRFDSKAKRFTKTLVIKIEVEVQVKIAKGSQLGRGSKKMITFLVVFYY